MIKKLLAVLLIISNITIAASTPSSAQSTQTITNTTSEPQVYFVDQPLLLEIFELKPGESKKISSDASVEFIPKKNKSEWVSKFMKARFPNSSIKD